MDEEIVIRVDIKKDGDIGKIDLTGTKEFEQMNNSLLLAKDVILEIIKDSRIPVAVRQEYAAKTFKLFN